nr:carbonic anhydrase-related protein 10-like [Penaeus vannamei]
MSLYGQSIYMRRVISYQSPMLLHSLENTRQGIGSVLPHCSLVQQHLWSRGISNTEEYILLNTFLTFSYIIFSECATCHSAMQLIISTVITPNLHPYTTEAKTGIKDILPFDSCGSSSSPPGINWSQWWTYDGISGPRFWGVINPAWGMCREGRRQSPINVDPKTLLFDPNLTPFTLDKVTVAGELINTGHSVEWRAARDSVMVNITGGPLSYVYTVTHARLHFGERDQQGSEHLLDNRAFPAELQLYGYNSQLYRNFSQASGQVYGVVGIALLVQIQFCRPQCRVPNS